MKSLIRLFAALSLLGTLTGCTASTDSTEVGVRIVLVGLSPGIQDDIYLQGGTYFFLRPFSEWLTYDTALQNLEMSREHATGDRYGDDSLRFKTIDGNDISVNCTIAWRIREESAPYLARFVGQSTAEVGEKLVRPVSRTVVRDVLNQLTSEAYYNSKQRFESAEDARDRLNAILEPEGVHVDEVLLGEHKFNETYEKTIHDKKVAEQEAARLVSAAEAAGEELKRDLQRSLGEVRKAVEQAKGEAEKKRLEADATYYENQQQAEAILAERRAKAEALRARAKALSGAGGKSMVKLEVAKALQGKKLVFVPAGGGMDLRQTDMNKLLETYGATSLAQGK